MDDMMVVSPDVGGVARARDWPNALARPCRLWTNVVKRQAVAGMTVIGDVTGKKCIIVDDMCDTRWNPMQGR